MKNIAGLSFSSVLLVPDNNNHHMPYIYAITPTYERVVQKPELTRLSQTLLHVRNLHWIVVEDSPNKTELVTSFLQMSGMNYTHLSISSKSIKNMPGMKPAWLSHKGVLQRNIALEWIRRHSNGTKDDAVIYFADDDNTYDLKIFEEVSSSNNSLIFRSYCVEMCW